ncbi:DUF4870 family protein [Roseinatronobacter sp. NSM]|uniref:DUF4870 family protein n=1 Tax=Roseinatronobacter sp. NSM TaxID=3457785 RepID=UPI0040375EC4
MTYHTTTQPHLQADLGAARIIYILFGLGFFLPLLTAAGVIYGYMSRGKSSALDSHIRFQLRTFWIGFAMVITGGILAVFMVGYLILLFWFLWTVIRIISGFLTAGKGHPVQNPAGLAFKA